MLNYIEVETHTKKFKFLLLKQYIMKELNNIILFTLERKAKTANFRRKQIIKALKYNALKTAMAQA